MAREIEVSWETGSRENGKSGKGKTKGGGGREVEGARRGEKE